MGIFSWLVLGFIAGAIAKWIMPGIDGAGFWHTVILGVIGGIVGGWLGTLVGWGGVNGINLGSVVTATVGAFIVLYIYRQMKGH